MIWHEPGRRHVEKPLQQEADGRNQVRDDRPLVLSMHGARTSCQLIGSAQITERRRAPRVPTTSGRISRYRLFYRLPWRAAYAPTIPTGPGERKPPLQGIGESQPETKCG